jgi:hypothetical protein
MSPRPNHTPVTATGVKARTNWLPQFTRPKCKIVTIRDVKFRLGEFIAAMR